jgi:hypothetical protein
MEEELRKTVKLKRQFRCVAPKIECLLHSDVLEIRRWIYELAQASATNTRFALLTLGPDPGHVLIHTTIKLGVASMTVVLH